MSIVNSTLEARDHSYLPGTSHPFLPRESLNPATSKKRQRPPSHESGFISIPVLALPGVVLFPGATLPLRLRESNWIEYLGNKIDESRRKGSPDEIAIGIIPMTTTTNSNADRRRGSWMRSGIHQRGGTEIFNIFNQHDLLVDIDNESASGSISDEEDENGSSNMHSEDVSDEEDGISARRARQQQGTREQSQDPLIGRTGCIVTITNTHGDSSFEDENRSQIGQVQPSGRTDGSIWQNFRERSQLVVTAVGTGRFRIIENKVDDGGMQTNFTRFRNSDGGHGVLSHIQFYWVQELLEEELPLPTMVLIQQQQLGRVRSIEGDSARTNDSASRDQKHRHDTLIRSLSLMTPYPRFVWHKFWPWRLLTDIESSLVEIASLKDVIVNCEDEKRKSPNAFCYWLADNMPLSLEEKISLLKMDCVMERLWFFQTKLGQLKRERIFLSCQACKSPLSPTGNAFTVGGAEGTTGNYVNEYGAIHQTITVRAIEENSLLYSGGAETRDSWFPGYSWTIASCRWCHSHVGWKFILLDGGEENSNASPTTATVIGPAQLGNDRPKVFWGLSGGAVTTQQCRQLRL